MKRNITTTTRYAAVAIAAALIGATSIASAQEPEESPSPAAKAAQDEPGSNPNKVGSMAAVGAKPSKAELEKQKQERGAATSSTTATQKPAATTAGATQLSDQDRQFVKMAAEDGMREVHMGQMAVQNGQSEQVKKLGQRIVTDHGKANTELMAIARRKGMDFKTQHKMPKMSRRDMQNFDQAWLAMMVNDHQKDIAAFQRQAQQGTDADLRKFAKKTLPTLQKHLKMVQDAQQKIGSTATAPSQQQTGTTAKKNR